MSFGIIEIALVMFLGIGVLISMWYFGVAEKYRRYLKRSAYGRGANALKSGDTLNLSCRPGEKICVYRATQICTDPDTKNYENPQTDPIASGLGSDSYGNYNSSTTVDMTKDLSDKCNGEQTCSYKFASKPYPNGMKCGGKSQLLSNYTCISGNNCQSYSS